jgi:hypothetical protein
MFSFPPLFISLKGFDPMKKILASLLAAAFLFTLTVGCGETKPEPKKDTPAKDAPAKDAPKKEDKKDGK